MEGKGRVSARVISKSVVNPDHLYAIGDIRGEHYFIQRDSREPESCMFFDWIYQRVPEKERRDFPGWRVELNEYSDKRGVLIAPRDFLYLYKNQGVYIVKSDFRTSGSFCFSFSDSFEEKGDRLRRRVNSWIDFPVTEINGEGSRNIARVYYEDSFKNIEYEDFECFEDFLIDFLYWQGVFRNGTRRGSLLFGNFHEISPEKEEAVEYLAQEFPDKVRLVELRY
jgi:hypothetical protein